MRRRYTTLRSLAALAGLGILATAIAAPALAAPPTPNTKPLKVEATGLTGLGSFLISAGQTIPVTIVVSNTGKNTINDVHLTVGKDASPTTAENGDATAPVALPEGVTVAADGCTPVPPTGGRLITCDIGTLRSKQIKSFNVTIATAEDFTTEDLPLADQPLRTKATVTGAEGGNDSGGNIDTKSIEGNITVTPFSCDSVSVYKPGNDKNVETCAVGDPRNTNHQSALVVLPTGLTTATVQENHGACSSCIGDEVEALITGDTIDNTIVWTIVIDLTAEGISVPNPQKLVVTHQGDLATDLLQTFELSKKNACKTASQKLCGTAFIETIDGHSILNVTIQTGGNGKTRILN